MTAQSWGVHSTVTPSRLAISVPTSMSKPSNVPSSLQRGTAAGTGDRSTSRACRPPGPCRGGRPDRGRRRGLAGAIERRWAPRLGGGPRWRGRAGRRCRAAAAATRGDDHRDRAQQGSRPRRDMQLLLASAPGTGGAERRHYAPCGISSVAGPSTPPPPPFLPRLRELPGEQAPEAVLVEDRDAEVRRLRSFEPAPGPATR